MQACIKQKITSSLSGPDAFDVSGPDFARATAGQRRLHICLTAAASNEAEPGAQHNKNARQFCSTFLFAERCGILTCMKTQILYEDKDIIVCDKPAGLAVQSGRASEPDMVSELKNYLAKNDRKVVSVSSAGANVRCGLPSEKKPVYLGVIHRLDQPVSGVLVFAKNQRAAARLSGQIADHSLQKTYRAIVMVQDGGGEKSRNSQEDLKNGETGVKELTDYMVKMPGGGARIAAPEERDAKKAQLSYRCLEHKEGCALLEIDLKTGRHHQIRLQMAHANMPLLGDNRYGNEGSQDLSRRLGIRTIQLQAVRLSFVHPGTGKRVSFETKKKLGFGE